MVYGEELLESACKLACGLICQQLHYIRKLRENEENMQNEWTTLRSQKKDICENLNTGNVRHGKRLKEAVTDWLQRVGKIEEKVNSLRSGRSNHMCFKEFCPNYYSRLKRSKKVLEILHEVKELQEKGMPFAQGENLFIDSLPETSLPTTTLHGTSAERKKEEILQCILNLDVSKIGVYGMGGVGKTTIMTQIYNELKKNKDFEIIIWVTVSSSLNEKGIQNKIAEQLDCQFSPSADLLSRAQVLHEAFGRRKNFIIILDDIWERVSLGNVGIPEPVRSNGSKVVWTTRSRKVCNSMESEREIEVKGLTDEEAWSLFKDKVGAEDVVMSSEIQPIAKKVASECGGLPLALITVGRALRKANQPPVWRNAWQQLKTSRGDQIPDMSKEVFGSLEFSYNWLSSDKIRACFLYCALYPEDYDISVDDLIEYWMAEGLIDEEVSLQIEKDKGHAYLKELKDACMIQSSKDYEEHVKMHDLLRDLAIYITKGQFMVKAGLQLQEPPKEEEWIESLERVSLMSHKIEIFEGQPNCHRLSTLWLHKSLASYNDKTTFSDAFFKHMHKLRVLDLSYTGIESLPNSLSDLVNLCALILNDCRKLECLPSLARLHKLRQLKLRGLCSLKELPHGLENLVKLRHLDISGGLYKEGWESFPSGALSKKSSLEILLMDSSKWRLSYGREGDVEDDSTFGEITRLKKLTRFSVNFADVLTFNSYIRKAYESKTLNLLDFFRFQVHHKYDAHNVGNESMEEVKLPATTNFLGIVLCNFIHLSDIFGSDGLRRLICVMIDRCDKMEWIGKDGENILPSLETLHLIRLDSFQGLWRDKGHESFKNLRWLYITGCRKLKYLIPIDLLANNLQNLEEISIGYCSGMKNIISGNASATMASLPKLRKLNLYDLPALISICPGKLVCDSLCEINIYGCDELKKLPFVMKNERPSGIMRIQAMKEWWDMLEWEDPQLEELLQPFFKEYRHTPSWYNTSVRIGNEMMEFGKLDIDAPEFQKVNESIISIFD